MHYHEIANLFPMMTAAERAALKRDIAANGVQLPIVTYRGQVLEGRNRFAIVEELKAEGRHVACPTIEFHGEPAQALSYVLSLNLQRRHLSSSQKAALTIKANRMASKYSKDSSQELKKWRGKLTSRIERRVLDSVLDAYPKPVTLQHLAQQTGYNQRQEELRQTVLRMKGHGLVSKTKHWVKLNGSLLPQNAADYGGDVASLLASQAGTNRGYIFRAAKIAAHSEVLLERVCRGELTIPEAAREVESGQQSAKGKLAGIMPALERLADAKHFVSKIGVGSAERQEIVRAIDELARRIRRLETRSKSRVHA